MKNCSGQTEGTRTPPNSAKSPATRSLKAVYEVDQSPIGRTPRSMPATYVGFFDDIRQLFAQTPEARLRGYSPSRFSFNSAQGRCPECEGAGQMKLEMNFLPPAYITCETCRGTRFNRETLDIEYRGKNIAQVLELERRGGARIFRADPASPPSARSAARHRPGLSQARPDQSDAERRRSATHEAGHPSAHRPERAAGTFRATGPSAISSSSKSRPSACTWPT